MITLWILWFIPCALANRIRGGMFGPLIKSYLPFWSTTTARLSITFFMLIPTWNAYKIEKVFISWILFYIGFIFGWKAWQSMSNIPKDIFSMGARGLILTVPVGICLINYQLTLCGCLMGIVYYIGKFLPVTQNGELDGGPTNNVTWGEYMFGAILGFFIGIHAIG
jgi:hypothetical protein